MLKHFFYLLLLLCISPQAFSQFASGIPSNFVEAKKAARIIWSDHRQDVYCGCQFDKHLKVDTKSCNYVPFDRLRGKRIEWDHVVPASWFGRQRPCWRENICVKKNGKTFKGRQCCEQIDDDFRKMYLDLHNLIPAIGEVNAARSAFRFSEFTNEDEDEPLNFNGCKIAIDFDRHFVVPKDEIKGLIARVYLYMSETYPFTLSHKQQVMFEKWNKEHPPTSWEKEWNSRVKEVQGNDNRFISDYR